MGLPPCEFRLERPAERSRSGAREIACQAAGSVRLGIAGQDTSAIEAICGRCPIPDVLTHDPWACLYLRPIKVLNANEEATYFTCRWFYKLQTRGQPTDMTFCHGCSYWFPRPALDMIVSHQQEAEAIRRFMVEGEEPIFSFSEVAAEPEEPWWRRVLTKLRPS